MLSFPHFVLAKSEISAEWGLFSLGVGVLIFIYIMARLFWEYRKNR